MHNEWAKQDMFRRNAAGYTKILKDEKWVDIKYIGELLKNPNGEVMYGGELHSRPSIPSPGLRYAFVNSKDIPTKEEYFGGLQLVIHQDYLKSRKQLKCEYTVQEIPLPQSIVKKMELKYGMKAQRSLLCTKIDGRYTQGTVQFAGEYKAAPKDPNVDYKRALALNVIAEGDSVYAKEVYGFYDEESKTCTWNADDEGEYTPTIIYAAFEGPKGLELCYAHYAPESSTVGMFFLHDGKINDVEYTCYHNMIDEPTPIWKKDIAQMQKLFQSSSKGNKNPLTKYQLLYLDNDNVAEIWMRTKDDMQGAVFTFKDGNPQLVATEDEKTSIAFYEDNEKGSVKITREEGAIITTSLYVIKDSKVVEKFFLKDLDGEITESQLNGKSLTKWEAADYLDKTPSQEYRVSPNFININNE